MSPLARITATLWKVIPQERWLFKCLRCGFQFEAEGTPHCELCPWPYVQRMEKLA